MEKRTDFPRKLFLLVALLCVCVGTWAQSISSMATCGEDNVTATSTKLKAAPASVPMAPRQGDVNADGSINISDVTDLIDMLLKGETSYSSSDVNGNGIVNISDVTDLIDMLLNGSNAYSYSNGLYNLYEIYKSMRTAGWSTTGNTHQCFGISAYNLMAEVMGDDMIMGSQGSGWFWYDAAYNVKERYMYYSWRSYDLWNAYYTWIANANYILEAAKSMTGSTSEKNYIKGQAYAIRAYSYFMLAQSFARTYKGHESDPCVPIYEGLVFNGSTGQPRATVAQVYAQIDADINQAVTLLDGTTQLAPDHIGYAVALGLRARIALVEEDWAKAYNSAVESIDASGKSILNVSDFIGLNDAHAGNVMWGADIPLDEVGMYASFFTHMSVDAVYGQRAPKKISKWLYNKMSSTDARRNWWYFNDWYDNHVDYVQKKFDFSNVQTWEGDYIWMRVEEMYLTAAEAACRLGQATTARVYLSNLMFKRDPNYSCNKTGTSLGVLTTDETGSLLEEILIQRRLELWGEDGRIYTIRRLRQGLERTSENGWPASLLLSNRSLQDPESYPWVLTIPQSEFYDYYSRMIEAVDQNPIDDYPSGEVEEIERAPQHISFVEESKRYFMSSTQDLTVAVQMTRPVATDKPYYALLSLSKEGVGYGLYYVCFAPNSLETTVTIPFSSDIVMPGKHKFTLSLTDLEMSVANSSQLTSTKIEIDCQNIDPEGQNISFTAAEQNIKARYDGVDMRIKLTRAKMEHDYKAKIIFTALTDGYMYLRTPYVTFKAGESTAVAEVYVSGYGEDEGNQPQSFVLTLSDEDIATADPNIGGQITSTHVTVELGEPENQNISFVHSSDDWGTDNSETTKYVRLSRIVTDNDYTAHVHISNNSNHVTLRSEEVIFEAGSSEAYAVLDFKDMEEGETYSCVLTLSDADIATADPTEEQITSTTVSVTCYAWMPAGTCTFTDYTWGDDDGNPMTAYEVPIINIEGSDRYRIISPLYYVYKDDPNYGPTVDTSNFEFHLLDDGGAKVDDGIYFNYWGYQAYYDATNYGGYCFVGNDGNTYDVNFLLQSGNALYSGGRFTFTWDR